VGVEPVEEQVETDLSYPAELREVPRAADITDPSYVPATTADGLEEVGGLEGWWDNPEHWGSSKDYRGFGPVNKVTDPAVLEVLTKQAVVEAIAVVAQVKSLKKATDLMLDYGNKDQAILANTEIVAGPDGAAALKSEKDVKGIQGVIQRNVQSQKDSPEAYIPSPEEAREMIKAWGSSWKATQLKDPFVKFYVSSIKFTTVCS
jgi:hypothetical protein